MKQKTQIALMVLVLPFLACAHLPSNLTEWARNKGVRLGECAVKELLSRGDAKACLGPNYIRDLGTEACGQAHELLSSLPAVAPTGRESK